jgi:hypothetical protein
MCVLLLGGPVTAYVHVCVLLLGGPVTAYVHVCAGTRLALCHLMLAAFMLCEPQGLALLKRLVITDSMLTGNNARMDGLHHACMLTQWAAPRTAMLATFVCC